MTDPKLKSLDDLFKEYELAFHNLDPQKMKNVIKEVTARGINFWKEYEKRVMNKKTDF